MALFTFNLVTFNQSINQGKIYNTSGSSAEGKTRERIKQQIYCKLFVCVMQVPGGIDFSNAEIDPDTGKKCIFKGNKHSLFYPF